MITKHILLKRILPSILVTTIVLVFIGYNFANKKANTVQQIQVNFNLEDMNGNQFNQKHLKQKPSLLFFGFTHCPDVCPASLQLLTNLIQDLGPDAGLLLSISSCADSLHFDDAAKPAAIDGSVVLATVWTF